MKTELIVMALYNKVKSYAEMPTSRHTGIDRRFCGAVMGGAMWASPPIAFTSGEGGTAKP